MSMKLTPAAAASTTTWPGPGSGSGWSACTRTSGPPVSVTTIARMTSRPSPRLCSGVQYAGRPAGAGGSLAGVGGSWDKKSQPGPFDRSKTLISNGRLAPLLRLTDRGLGAGPGAAPAELAQRAVLEPGQRDGRALAGRGAGDAVRVLDGGQHQREAGHDRLVAADVEVQVEEGDEQAGGGEHDAGH